MKTIQSSVKKSPDTLLVDPHATQIACDGGNGILGHPLVYYSFEGRPSVQCLYCGRVFVKDAMS